MERSALLKILDKVPEGCPLLTAVINNNNRLSVILNKETYELWHGVKTIDMEDVKVRRCSAFITSPFGGEYHPICERCFNVVEHS